MSYATRDHVFNLALSAQGFTVLPRPVAAGDVDAPSGTIRLKAHGLNALDHVTIPQLARGTLPPEVSGFVVYMPIPLSMDLLQLAHPVTGLPITFTDPGTAWGVAVEPMRRLDMHLDAQAAIIDQSLTAHATPILPDPTTGRIPWILIEMNAGMAALSAVNSLQLENAEARAAVDRLLAKGATYEAQRAVWSTGVPLLPTPLDQNTIADTGPRARGRAPVGWERRAL